MSHRILIRRVATIAVIMCVWPSVAMTAAQTD
jgi:hypothetical protein